MVTGNIVDAGAPGNRGGRRRVARHQRQPRSDRKHRERKHRPGQWCERRKTGARPSAAASTPAARSTLVDCDDRRQHRRSRRVGRGRRTPPKREAPPSGGGLLVGTVITGATKITGSTISRQRRRRLRRARAERRRGRRRRPSPRPACHPDDRPRMRRSPPTCPESRAPREPSPEAAAYLGSRANRARSRCSARRSPPTASKAGLWALGGTSISNSTVDIRNSIVAGGAGPAGMENCGGAGADIAAASTSRASTSAASTRRRQGQRRTRCSARCRTTAARPRRWLPAPEQPRGRPGQELCGLVDQRGVIRPIDFPSIANAPGGDGSDIGAVELQPSNAFRLSASSRRTRRRARRP